MCANEKKSGWLAFGRVYACGGEAFLRILQLPGDAIVPPRGSRGVGTPHHNKHSSKGEPPR